MAEDRLHGRRAVYPAGNGWSTDCPKADVMDRLCVPGNFAGTYPQKQVGRLCPINQSHFEHLWERTVITRLSFVELLSPKNVFTGIGSQ